MSENVAYGLRYAPSKCSHHVCGECSIEGVGTKNDNCLGMENCIVFKLETELQRFKEENKILKKELINQGCIYLQGIGYLKGGR